MQHNFEAGTTYHVYNRANNYENLFIEEKNYPYFLSLLRKYLIPIADIYAYCLMPNHFHIIMEIKDIKELPEEYSNGKRKIYQCFSNMFNAYSKAINKAYGRRGSLFQKHLKRKIITDIDYLRNVICYVHMNPIHHGFTKKLSDYNHSSYKSIIESYDGIVNRNATIDFFDGIENFIYNHQYLSGLVDLIGIGALDDE